MEINETLSKQITETAYLTTENTKRYRPILRYFYEEYEKINYMLYKEEVWNYLKNKPNFENYTIEMCENDLTAMVLCRNIEGFVENECLEHQGLKGFKKYNEPIYLTIYNLSNIYCINEKSKYKKVLITENPAVFMEITEKCKRKDFPLVCTYGQVKLAGIILLDLLVDAGYKLYYSGDLDPEGIQIADKLKQRYGESLEFIGFDIETYLKNISNIQVNETRINKLKHINSKELLETCNCLKKNKRVAYEEENIQKLIDFIENL